MEIGHIPSSAAAALLAILRTMLGERAEQEFSLLGKFVPRIAGLLGYAEAEVFFEVPITDGKRRLRVDAMFAPLGPSSPHVMVEVKRDTTPSWILQAGIDQLELYRSITPSPFGLLLSSSHLVILHGSAREDFDLRRVTLDEAERIVTTLRRPSTAASPARGRPAPDARQFRSLLDDVTNARTNDEKKKSLEKLAALAFSAHTFLRCKYLNLRTRSSEIDIVCEALSFEHARFLADYGRYFIVECKNWAAPVGAKDIRDFLGKLRKLRIKLGVYFASNGITGEANGSDAVREIHSAYDQDGTTVVVVSGQDLSQMSDLTDILSTIEERVDALRFDY